VHDASRIHVRAARAGWVASGDLRRLIEIDQDPSQLRGWEFLTTTNWHRDLRWPRWRHEHALNHRRLGTWCVSAAEEGATLFPVSLMCNIDGTWVFERVVFWLPKPLIVPLRRLTRRLLWPANRMQICASVFDRTPTCPRIQGACSIYTIRLCHVLASENKVKITSSRTSVPRIWHTLLSVLFPPSALALCLLLPYHSLFFKVGRSLLNTHGQIMEEQR
jgi:hypothetical protein